MQLTQLFRTRCALIALLGISILYLGGAAVAQNAQGTIVGHVTDSTGAAVATKITLTESSTGISQSATTSSTGDYTVTGLNPGNYSVTAEAAGFSKAVSSGLTLEIEQTLRQDFKLAVGNVTATVQVTANTQMLHTDNDHRSGPGLADDPEPACERPRLHQSDGHERGHHH